MRSVFLTINTNAQVTVFPSSYSMEQYSGTWDARTAAHLARRALFGPSYGQIQALVNQGSAQSAVQLLLRESSRNGKPLTFHPDEAIARMGESWVHKKYPQFEKSKTDNARNQSLKAWLIQEMMNSELSIHNRMTLFWINHFGLEKTNDARANYAWYELLFEYALGNFKTIIQKVTISPAMLRFLSGDVNVGSNPNENYAREFLELFTTGKGPQIASGDYTRYTEQDVDAAARIFTGYSIKGMRSHNETHPYSIFTETRHDNDIKNLSEHFENKQITGAGEQEFLNYIDVVFENEKFGYFFCEEIYQFFVGKLTKNVRDQIIPEMRKTLIQNNFNIIPVLQQLLASEHFYDTALRGSLVKSPYDYVFSIYNPTKATLPGNLSERYSIANQIYRELARQGQDLLIPPSVSGWPAYYQADQFHKLWLSGVTLGYRFQFADARIAGNGFRNNSKTLRPDGLYLVNELSDPSNAVKVIDDLCLVFFSNEIAMEDKLFFKTILTDNLPDFEWRIEYSQYKSNRNDPVKQKLIDERIRKVLQAMSKNYMFQTF